MPEINSLNSVLSSFRGFKMALLNINSLGKHIDELRILMSDKPLDVLCINESKLDNSTTNELIGLEGYNLVRRDRNIFGGGVCVYLRDSINYTRRHDLEENELEIIVLEIMKPNSQPFLVINWYRPPNSPVIMFDQFEKVLDKIDNKYKEIYILGDLNCNLLSNPLGSHTNAMLDILINYQLSQLINEPTRITSDTRTIIDWFITNNSECITTFGVYPLSISDHNLIYAVRKIGLPKGRPRYIECRNFKNFDQASFLFDLKTVQWPIIEQFNDVNIVWDAWKNVFLDIVNKHAPCRSFRVRNKPSPWLTSELKKLMFDRDRLKKKAVLSNNPDDWSLYKRRRNCVNCEIKRVKRVYFQTEIEKNSGDSKATWKILNNAMGKKSQNICINEIQTSSGEILREPGDIAEHINSHFADIGPRLASKVSSSVDSSKAEDYLSQTDLRFQFSSIDNSSVLKLIEKLNLRKASGLDKISNKILKLAGPYICKSLTSIFNMSIECKVFPDDLKIGKVFPLYKSDKQNDANNYRPISVLSTIARLFERLMYNQFSSYLTENRLLDSRQSGFRSLHSTLTALLDMTNQWCFNIDKGMISGVIFLDLKKAFDTIDHEILLMKLANYGVGNESVEWFRSYLSNRQQICHVNGIYSDKKLIKCGVPQGSILGPILFLIYINDLPRCLEYSVGRLFADDTNVTFTGHNLEKVQVEMTSDLNKIFHWLCANKLTLNVLKTEFMLIGSRQKLAVLEGDVALSVGGISLSKAETVKCLGVNIDEYLIWDKHIDSIRLKVTQNLRVLKKVRDFLNVNCLLSLYNAIIEPYFTYCSIVWDSINDSLENKLQKLQNRAARIITKASYLKSSSLILHELGWMTIKEMREKHKAILMYKIISGIAPSYLSEMFTFSCGSDYYDLRRSNFTLALPKNSTNYYNSSFAYTGAKIWNSLPDDCKSASSLSNFIKKLVL